MEIGTLVEYHGSDTNRHGRYRIEQINEPIQLPGVTDEEMTEAYPDGKAYALWPEGVTQTWGSRGQAMVNVRPVSFTVVEETTNTDVSE